MERDWGSKTVCMCVCMCAHVWMQGRGSDAVRYVMHYQIRLSCNVSCTVLWASHVYSHRGIQQTRNAFCYYDSIWYYQWSLLHHLSIWWRRVWKSQPQELQYAHYDSVYYPCSLLQSTYKMKESEKHSASRTVLCSLWLSMLSVIIVTSPYLKAIQEKSSASAEMLIIDTL